MTEHFTNNLRVEVLKESLNAKKVVVGYHPKNLRVQNLYASLGFVDNGDRFGKEKAVIKYITELSM